MTDSPCLSHAAYVKFLMTMERTDRVSWRKKFDREYAEARINDELTGGNTAFDIRMKHWADADAIGRAHFLEPQLDLLIETVQKLVPGEL